MQARRGVAALGQRAGRPSLGGRKGNGCRVGEGWIVDAQVSSKIRGKGWTGGKRAVRKRNGQSVGRATSVSRDFPLSGPYEWGRPVGPGGHPRVLLPKFNFGTCHRRRRTDCPFVAALLPSVVPNDQSEPAERAAPARAPRNRPLAPPRACRLTAGADGPFVCPAKLAI